MSVLIEVQFSNCTGYHKSLNIGYINDALYEKIQTFYRRKFDFTFYSTLHNEDKDKIIIFDNVTNLKVLNHSQVIFFKKFLNFNYNGEYFTTLGIFQAFEKQFMIEEIYLLLQYIIYEEVLYSYFYEYMLSLYKNKFAVHELTILNSYLQNLIKSKFVNRRYELIPELCKIVQSYLTDTIYFTICLEDNQILEKGHYLVLFSKPPFPYQAIGINNLKDQKFSQIHNYGNKNNISLIYFCKYF